MLDMRWIRENTAAFDAALVSRNLSPMASTLVNLDAKKREAMLKLQQMQSHRNELAAAIGAAKKNNGDISTLEVQASALKNQICDLERDEKHWSCALQDALNIIPNVPLKDVPVGKDETANVCVRTVGTPTNFNFCPRPHYKIGEDLGMIDFATATRISGSRFVILRGLLARMERALKSFMLDIHTQKFGYEEISVPLLVNSSTMYGTGQLPKFFEDSFKTTDGRWLIPTSEVPLTNMVGNSSTNASRLPLRFTAYSPCFRSEAGAAGRDTGGMIRNHQFSKVELVSIVHPADGLAELERMTGAAETVLQSLGLAYRVMLLSTGDMGFSSCKTYDIEVWIPSEGVYREISSCSLCGDFQARRMGARYRKEENGKESEKGFVHTLNGSGLAIGRTIVAILENYQLSNGNVIVPEALISYMDGVKELSRNELKGCGICLTNSKQCRS
ncbi:MAG: serine--tRNA ligase [Holosporaceae bacterium]|jgi:seryl-tRNA synthetase|nr:serine--tRNA ligase [Holosporaceae bacterium]